MKKVIGALSVAVLFAAAATGVAGAAQPEVSGFVCPILGGEAGVHVNGDSPIVQLPGGDYTIIGPDVYAPLHATNDNGAGTPGGDHTSPGDPDYTAIWAK